MADDETDWGDAHRAAYDELVALDGDVQWVAVEDVGDREVVEDLARFGVAQLDESGDRVSVAGVDPEAVDDGVDWNAIGAAVDG